MLNLAAPLYNDLLVWHRSGSAFSVYNNLIMQQARHIELIIYTLQKS